MLFFWFWASGINKWLPSNTWLWFDGRRGKQRSNMECKRGFWRMPLCVLSWSLDSTEENKVNVFIKFSEFCYEHSLSFTGVAEFSLSHTGVCEHSQWHTGVDEHSQWHTGVGEHSQWHSGVGEHSSDTRVWGSTPVTHRCGWALPLKHRCGWALPLTHRCGCALQWHTGLDRLWL